MPFFTWYGINLMGVLCHGTRFARTPELLREALFEENIALLKCCLLWRNRIITRVTATKVAEWCGHFALLHEAGLRADEALDVLSVTSSNIYIRALSADCAQGLRKGVSLERLIHEHTPPLDQVISSLLVVGEATGAISAVLRMAQEYYLVRADIARKLRSGLLVPVITGVLLVCVLGVILIGVIPRFEHFLQVIRYKPERSARLLFVISAWLRARAINLPSSGVYLLSLVLVLTIIKIILRQLSKTTWPLVRALLILKIPVLGKSCWLWGMFCFLRTFSLMRAAGLPITQAYLYAQRAVYNPALKRAFAEGYRSIEAGESLASLFQKQGTLLTAPELSGLLSIGERIGDQATVSLQAAQLVQNRLYGIIQVLMVAVPLIALSSIALIIGFIIITVYSPLLKISYTIGL